jgi:hypothetical protein
MPVYPTILTSRMADSTDDNPTAVHTLQGGFGLWSSIALLGLLMAVFALLTDPVFLQVFGRRLRLFDPNDVGRLDQQVVFRPLSANDMGNLATIQTLVEQGTWVVAVNGPTGPESRSVFRSSDIARINGRYYSVRPPVLPFVLSGVYWLESQVLGWSFTGADARQPGPTFAYCYFSLVWLTAGLSTAVMAVQVARSLALLGVARGKCWTAGLLLGLGSLALPYATVLNHHSVAGALIATATFLLLRGQLGATAVGIAEPRSAGSADRRSEFTKRQAVVAGLCAGFAATVDVAVGGLFLVAALAWVLAVPALRQRLPCGIAAVLVPGILHGVLNYQITGDIVPALVRKEYFDYPHTSIPLDGISGLPHHTTPGEIAPYLAKLLWGPRGLLTYSPLLLFSALAATRMLCRREHRLRLAALLLSAWLAAFLAYLSIYTNNFSGACYGIRWLVPLLPTGYLVLFAGWELLHRSERWGAVVALATSVPIAWTGALFGPWQLDHVFPVLCWLPPPQWTGPFGTWASDIPYLGWVMMLTTLGFVTASVLRWVLGALRNHSSAPAQ